MQPRGVLYNLRTRIRGYRSPLYRILHGDTGGAIGRTGVTNAPPDGVAYGAKSFRSGWGATNNMDDISAFTAIAAHRSGRDFRISSWFPPAWSHGTRSRARDAEWTRRQRITR